jgi:receptor-type tyrosine-protein phosphatase N
MNDPDNEKKSKAGVMSPEKPSKSFTTRYTSSPTTPPQGSGLEITAGHLILSYIEDYLRNKNKLEEEWQALETYIPEDVSTNDAMQKENHGKNRYPDSVPYDHSRVRLDLKQNPGRSDYINASFVYDSHPSKPEYIVSQGPLASTSGDFWQMIWEQNISILVLLTQLNDRGLPQCFQYWPSSGSKLYGAFKVQLVSEHVFSVDYVIRSFYVHDTKRGGSRTVTQLHFLSWTSTGVPPTPTPLLQFRRKVHKAVNDDSPMLVHCSDGMGRSGAFCLIDMSIRRIGIAKEINLAATVEHLRDQRANMVKTKEQYEFALTALVEETQSLLRSTD